VFKRITKHATCIDNIFNASDDELMTKFKFKKHIIKIMLKFIIFKWYGIN